MEFKIDKGVPMPEHASTKYPFRRMDVGDSFFTPSGKRSSISSLASLYTRERPGIKFSTRTVTENGVAGVRVWRIA